MVIEEFYKEVESGREIQCDEVVSYIKNFPNIVIWGASYLGKVIAEFLESQEISDFTWWDIRAAELGEVNGRPIVMPFTDVEEPVKENTLVILCIGNTAIMNKLLHRLTINRYFNVLRGDKLFMGVKCPFNISTEIRGEICNGTMTCRSMFCSRLHNIVKQKNNKGGLFLENITLMITTHCSLKCKYCCAYMNSYPEDRKHFFPYEQIAKDIDALFGAVDAIGSITIQGGEPFLHPDIDRIVAKVLKKKNIGIVSIATNGIFSISKDKLKVFQDSRLNVAFSGYYDALSEDKLNIFYKNIDFLRENHVPVTVGVRMLEWAIPSTLWNRHYTEDVMKAKKNVCKTPERCLQLMNGRLYPCLFSVSLHGAGVADYPGDYVVLSDDRLSEKIKEFMDAPFYYSCGHCSSSGGSTNMAGEQGFFDFITEREEE